MKLISEDQILDLGFRELVISEMIDGHENLSRKHQELRKHEIYRDRNQKWVMQALAHEGYKDVTLARMRNRASNISICRKIVNKLAQTYVGGVKRLVEDKQSQESIDLWTDELDVDTRFKKLDRYRQLFKNTRAHIVPVPVEFDDKGIPILFKMVMRILAPWEYDIIEDAHDPTKAKVLMLADFPERHRFHFHNNDIAGSQGFRQNTFSLSTEGHEQGHHGSFKHGDDKEQIIADSPADKGTEEDKRRVIWWSDHWHFTTDVKGIMTDAPKDRVNPIGVIPGIDLHGDQDGHYWAIGGEDVVDGSIGINKKITDRNFIEFTQGWGQQVITGQNIPKLLVGGPDNAYTIETTADGPQPQVFFASSNPNLDAWNNGIKMDLALLLSTNDLSPRNISASLDASNFPSGISLMIEQSEVVADVQDTQKLFQDKEPIFWEVLRRWHELFGGQNLLVPDMQDIPIFEDSNVKVKFHQTIVPISEKEKLETMRIRKELGLSSLTDLIMQDNPELSEDEAKQRATDIMAEKKERQVQFMGAPSPGRDATEPTGGRTESDEEPEDGQA